MYIDELEKYMVNIAAVIEEYGLDIYNEMADMVSLHNNSISQLGQGLSIHTLMMIFVKKGIVTEQELLDELNTSLVTFHDQINAVHNNYTKIMNYFNDGKEIKKQYPELNYKLEQRYDNTSHVETDQN